MDWQREARRLLRAQMALKDVRYKGLARALESVGVFELMWSSRVPLVSASPHG